MFRTKTPLRRSAALSSVSGAVPREGCEGYSEGQLKIGRCRSF